MEILECTLYKNGGISMDLSKFLNIVYRYLWLLVLAALVAGLTTFFQLSSRPDIYSVNGFTCWTKPG
jgi:uncharacterized protein involved in exopolysaccharide biosynthesis